MKYAKEDGKAEKALQEIEAKMNELGVVLTVWGDFRLSIDGKDWAVFDTCDGHEVGQLPRLTSEERLVLLD